MHVEIEFSWELNGGAKITVTADGYYTGGEIAFPCLGFVTPNSGECANAAILKGIVAEHEQMQEHAVICLCEKAREELKEAS